MICTYRKRTRIKQIVILNLFQDLYRTVINSADLADEMQK